MCQHFVVIKRTKVLLGNEQVEPGTVMEAFVQVIERSERVHEEGQQRHTLTLVIHTSIDWNPTLCRQSHLSKSVEDKE